LIRQIYHLYIIINKFIEALPPPEDINYTEVKALRLIINPEQ